MSDAVQTETLDRLFLELSQFTQATTKREIDLAAKLAQVKKERDELKHDIERHLAIISEHLERAEKAEQELATAQQENARLREALAAETERCAQVALSYWEYHKKAYLHHVGQWQAAADYHLQLQAAGSQIADRIRARPALGGE